MAKFGEIHRPRRNTPPPASEPLARGERVNPMGKKKKAQAAPTVTDHPDGADVRD